MADPAARKNRIQSIDAVRGVIMIVMTLDHVREFFHNPPFGAEDLVRTTAPLFFTRWITHFCAPVFFFFAGLGAFFYGQPRSRGELARYLVTRGFWLIVLEVTVERFFFYFNFDYNAVIILLILWALGWSMLGLAGLLYLGHRGLMAASLAMILLHNLADGVRAARFGSAAWVWNVLHQPGVFKAGGHVILIAYPLIPWIGVMGAGYALGKLFTLEPERRRTLLLRLGLAMTVAFLVIRAVNVYGDPAPWSVQPSALFTVLSFLRCTKYPPSLDFLLMTLGPALMLTTWLDRFEFGRRNPLQVFGRVPLFYFLLHLFVIHTLAALLNLVLTGRTDLAPQAREYTPYRGSNEACRLRVVGAEKEQAIIVDNPDAKPVKPTGPADKTPAECRVLSEENNC
jgi:uncharacterized membrane protein